MLDNRLIAWYAFKDAEALGKDSSENGNDAVPCGARAPQAEQIDGRHAAHFYGGENGISYLELPKDILKNVSDTTGFTVSAWVHADQGASNWERIMDFGKGQTGPYLFLTRFLRGVCFAGADIAADARKQCPAGEWQHIAMTVTGTKGGTLSSAGPRIYVNGELVADGFISQTSSGTYKEYRAWLATLEEASNYEQNYIGRSQFAADADFCGALADVRLYSDALSETELTGLMCESLQEEQIAELAKSKFLKAPERIVTGDLTFVRTLMDGRVQVDWNCDRPDIISASGQVKAVRRPVVVCLTAELVCGAYKTTQSWQLTVLPKSTAPYEITIHGNKETIDISETLYGLFYEDINNAADGGIYAEMVNNRSFEAFTFDTYDSRSGENGTSTGRNHEPLKFWFGDLEKVTVKNKGGLNEYFGLKDKDANAYYIEVAAGTTLYNRGFCDNRLDYSMHIKEGNGYQFSLWAKPAQATAVTVVLLDAAGHPVSNKVTVKLTQKGQWKKYKAKKLLATASCMGQLALSFEGATAVDMVSLVPEDVWGAKKEKRSASAHANFKCNSNYRLRRDLVEALVELHPRFLRFPGGCISEGSYIWENVYDWKESVGAVETRKENFNVWGYNMTMGLGYMEYFQLAEDLNAEPLPVMACGVLCQARSDYANPAGGKLQKKYIKNFTDLIDFAISTDFEQNEWAALRKQMGHEAPFGLHYLGVGNENWGTEFFASFEAFKTAIDNYMKKKYPGYLLTIISTAGAQADDTAYQEGWKFLAGYQKGGAEVAFTDGKKSFTEAVTWYKHNKNYMDTIVDEHYYRSNEYLLENADRYNYYYRSKKENQTSKVFVGEYASTDKNTLAGAVAEAAVMTGFEKNSDVVRLAATAPLFNKVVTDGTYRWTPDAIWFDNESMWRTPNYYVQQMFAKYLGKKLLETSYSTYVMEEKKLLSPCGSVTLMAEGAVEFKNWKVTANKGRKVLFEQKAEETLDEAFTEASASEIILQEKDGMRLFALNHPDWKNYTVEVTVLKKEDGAAVSVGVGTALDGPAQGHVYCVGHKRGTGLKVFKNGVEGYALGDFASSVYAGNLRACYDEPVPAGEYKITVNFGGKDGKTLTCYYTEAGSTQKKGLVSGRLEAYNKDVFHSVTADEKKVYAKLVNADNFSKKVLLTFDALDVCPKAEVITLSGAPELVNKSNVNTKEKEWIVPESQRARVKNRALEVILPANSVSVAVFDKNLKKF